MKSILPLLATATVIALGSTGCTSASTRPIVVPDGPTLSWPLDEHSTSDPAGDRTFRIEQGNHREAVLTQLDLPHAAAEQDVWVFTDSHSPEVQPRSLGLNTLVVAFSDDRITHLRLVNGKQAREILARAQIRTTPAAALLAASGQ